MTSDQEFRPLSQEEKQKYLALRDERRAVIEGLKSKFKERTETLIDVEPEKPYTNSSPGSSNLFQRIRSAYKEHLSGGSQRNKDVEDLEKRLIAANNSLNHTLDIAIEITTKVGEYRKNPIIVPNSTETCPECRIVSVYKSDEMLEKGRTEIYKCQICDNKYTAQTKVIRLDKI